jgi:hypothetical protein
MLHNLGLFKHPEHPRCASKLGELQKARYLAKGICDPHDLELAAHPFLRLGTLTEVKNIFGKACAKIYRVIRPQ